MRITMSTMLTNMHILIFIGCLILSRSTVSCSSQTQFSRQLLVTFQGRPGKTTGKMVQSFQLSFLKVYNNVSTVGVGNFRQITSVTVTRNAVASFGFSSNNQSAGYFVTQDFTWAVTVQGVCQGCDAQTFQLFDSDPIAPPPPTKQLTGSSLKAPYPKASYPKAPYPKAPYPKAPYPKAPYSKAPYSKAPITPSPTTCNCPAPRKSTFLQALNSLLPSSIDAVLAITLLFEEPTCTSNIDGQFQEYFVVTYSGDNSTNNNPTDVSCAAQSPLLEQLILETYNDLNALNTAGVCDTQFRRYTNVQFVNTTDNGSRLLLLGLSHQHRQLGPTKHRPTARPTQAPRPTSCTYGTSGICSGPCPPGKSFTPDNVNPPSHRALNMMKRNEKKEDKAIPIPIPVIPIETNNVVAHQSNSITEREWIDSRHRSLPVINGKCYCQANTVARRLPFRREFIKALNNRLQVIGPNGAGVITTVSEVDGIVPL